MTETRTGYKSTFDHDSFFGWINAFKRKDSRTIYRPSERPPYPIIIDKPTVQEVLSNLNLADLGLFCTGSLLGFFGARRCVRVIVNQELFRRSAFNMAWTFGILFSAQLAMLNSFYRLQVKYFFQLLQKKGFADNGLQWKKKEDDLKKYDFTTGYEEDTIWSFFRIKDK